jgi:hypothetical protein
VIDRFHWIVLCVYASPAYYCYQIFEKYSPTHMGGSDCDPSPLPPQPRPVPSFQAEMDDYEDDDQMMAAIGIGGFGKQKKSNTTITDEGARQGARPMVCWRKLCPSVSLLKPN